MKEIINRKLKNNIYEIYKTIIHGITDVLMIFGISGLVISFVYLK